jgi:hypothetical protein
MSTNIKICFSNYEVEAVIFDNVTARGIVSVLPIENNISLWGDEIYFPLTSEIKVDSLKDCVEKGDLAFWPEGNCLCIFFGPTPASVGNEIRPASPVGIFGKVTGDLSLFKKVKAGSRIVIK